MQSIGEISEAVQQIFGTIKVVYEPDIISFDPQQIILTKLRDALELASKIDTSYLTREIVEESNTVHAFNEVIEIINEEFDTLLTWKPGLYEVLTFKKSLEDDLESYFLKINQLEIIINSQSKVHISQLYIQTGLRLLKIILDLDHVIGKIHEFLDEKKEKEKENRCSAADYNIKLMPDKLNEFTRSVIKMLNAGYFGSLDNNNQITEIDVLMAFQDFFRVDITNTEWFNSDDMIDFMIEQNFGIKISEPSKPAYSNSEQTTLLKTFFSNNANDHFVDRLSTEFKIEIGKSIAILIYVLKNFEPCLLAIPYRKAKMFYGLLKSHFNREIGSYQSIFNYRVDPVADADDIRLYSNKVTALYKSSLSL